MRKVSEKDVLELLENRVINLRSELKRTEDALIALKGDPLSIIKNDVERGKRALIQNGKSNYNKTELPLVYDTNYKWDTKILFVLSKAEAAFKEDIVKEISTLERVQDSDKLTNLIGVKLSSLLKQDIIKAKREGKKFKYQLHAV